jgi:hypothetical protein
MSRPLICQPDRHILKAWTNGLIIFSYWVSQLAGGCPERILAFPQPEVFAYYVLSIGDS